MALNERLTAKAGKVFTRVWKKLEGPNQTVILLKPSDTTRDFETVIEIGQNWFFEYEKFRNVFELWIAEGEIIADDIAEATHIQINDDVYVIRDGDTVAPQGTDVYWKLLCDQFTERAQTEALL